MSRPDQIFELQVPFRTEGNLELHYEGAGIFLGSVGVPSLWMNLPGKGDLRVRQLTDLQGHVTLSSESDALAFVRLWGSPTTAWAVSPCAYELIERSKADLAYFLGSREHFDFIVDPKMSWYSVVGAKDLESVDAIAATVRSEGDHFIVRRTLATQDPESFPKARLMDVEEQVGRDGSYSRRVTRERRSPRTHWLPFLRA